MYVAHYSNNFLSTTCSYVYDTDVGGNMPSYKDYKYGVEYMFISLLAKSKFRTKVSCAYGGSTVISCPLILFRLATHTCKQYNIM